MLNTTREETGRKQEESVTNLLSVWIIQLFMYRNLYFCLQHEVKNQLSVCLSKNFLSPELGGDYKPDIASNIYIYLLPVVTSAVPTKQKSVH